MKTNGNKAVESTWVGWPALLLFLALTAYRSEADVVRLENGRELTGVISEETAEAVVLDLGVGTVTLKRSQIVFMEKSDDETLEGLWQDWSLRYFDHERYAPPGYEELVRRVRRLNASRAAAATSRRRIEQLSAESDGLCARVEGLEEDLLELAARVQVARPDADVETYNRLIMSNNTLSAGMALAQDSLARKRDDILAQQAVIGAYAQELAQVEAAFRAKPPADGAQPTEAEAQFVAQIERLLAGYRREFKQREVRTERRDAGVVVSATLNDGVDATFLLDTGASVVTISRALAERLNLNIRQRPAVRVTLADGGGTDAVPVLLRSIQVGEARVENVQAVVLRATPQPDVDGLLGMSFLRRFIISLDPAGNTLTLRTFSPAGR
ncbi:MAG: clan AA aspartic protease [Kiritimatiellae bacterium]|nr:clan AA aspartic protease [Kiritimatiellia bacterium]